MSQSEPLPLPEPTDRFQRVLAFATDEADALGHGFVTCQHLLYALSLESKGLACAVLETVGITPRSLRGLLAESAAPHDRVEGRIDLADEVQSALERSVQAARAWGHRALDTEHILFGIVSSPTSVDELLSSLRVEASDIVSALTALQKTAPSGAVRDEATHAYRLTLDSAWVLSLAVDTAREFAATAVSSLHLLIALMSVESPAQGVLVGTLGLDVDKLRRHVPQTSSGSLTRSRLPLSEELQRILGYGIGEAWNRGHLAVSPLHLAVGLARAEENMALDVLAELGVSRADLTDALGAAMPPPTVK